MKFVTCVAMGLLAAILGTSASAQPAPPLAKATFAGGCFWCVEADFDKVEGMVYTTSGYTGGHTTHPTYKEVSAGGTGHAEAVEVVYDPRKASYEALVEVFWHSIDPTTPNRQFCDMGDQYRTATFYHDKEQKRLTKASKRKLEQTKPFKEPIVTEIVPAGKLYPAEEYHQDFHKKNPIRYAFLSQRLRAGPATGSAVGQSPQVK
jgi:peptide-methionine (S)-S-oxide reductase